MTQKLSEKRFSIGDLRVEQRSEGEQGRVIVGYAAKFEKWSKPIYDYFVEKINRGAFDDCDTSDVIACFNHDKNTIVARTKSGTLKISIDSIGVRFEFEAPNTTHGNDLLELVRRGDISECSFRFVVAEEKWETTDNKNEYQKRELVKISKLIDVSLVVDPAYEDTEVVAERSLIEQRMRSFISPPVEVNEPMPDPTPDCTRERDSIDIDFDYYARKNNINNI